jgi:hypothetical protein
MKMRTATLAAWASTLSLALATTTGAFAQSINLPIPGIGTTIKSNAGLKANAGTEKTGKGRRATSKISDNESPRPTDRKANQQRSAPQKTVPVVGDWDGDGRADRSLRKRPTR